MFRNYDCIKEKIKNAKNNDELKAILIENKEGIKYLGADCTNYIYKGEEGVLISIQELIDIVEKWLLTLESKCKVSLEDSTLHREEIEILSEKRKNINRGIKKLVLEKYSVDEVKKLLKIRDDMDERFCELNNKTVEYRRAMED